MLSPDLDLLAGIDTPALVVDGAVLTANIARMAATARQAGVALRPHAKTHKCAEVAALQLEAGAVGICCATLAEAEAMAAAGIGGLLLTAPVMGAASFTRAARLGRQAGLAVACDHRLQVEGLGAAAVAANARLDAVVDVDVGQGRTGVTEVAGAVALAESIAATPGLAFAGIQGFAGNAQHIADPAGRAEAAARAARRLEDIATALRSAGLPPRLITGSGTGTFGTDAGGPYTELQVGSYVFMDADYARIVDEAGRAPDFGVSLYVLATVVSANRPGQVTVDAGVKALATNGPPPHVILGAPAGSTYRFAGDEHGVVEMQAGAAPPALGARVLLSATHCDPTVNLHRCLHVVDAGETTSWPVVGRYGD